jgi:hypothetical protein
MGRLQTLLKEAVTATETLTTSLRELQEILGMGEPLVKLPPLPRKRKAMKKLHALARQATKSVRRTRTASKQLDADITRVVQAHAGELVTVPQLMKELGMNASHTHIYTRFATNAARYGLGQATMKDGVKAWPVLPEKEEQDAER